MTQSDEGWGADPGLRYDELAARFRPTFLAIAEGAVQRETDRRYPREEVAQLKAAGFTALRIPVEDGGLGATLGELSALLVELAAADSNVVNLLRSHFGFTEDVLHWRSTGLYSRWAKRIVDGDTVGSGYSEIGESRMAAYSTKLIRAGASWHLSGQKFYTSGSLLADWIHVGAVDENGEAIAALVPTDTPGVRILDDWDGFGQQLSASGTALFDNVVVDDEFVITSPTRFDYATAFFQLVHVAALAGIARGAARDLARLVRERSRVYSSGNGSSVSTDPQILQVVGAVRASAYGANAVTLRAAEALQRAYEAREAAPQERELINSVADVEVNQAVRVATDLVLDSTTRLFDALGASAIRRGLGLDRYWRNARTLASHNPRIYRDRIVGDFAVNGARPLIGIRVGVS